MKKTFLIVVSIFTLMFSSNLFAEALSTININEATAQELSDALDGVGIVRAEAIVEYRATNGPFESVEELTDVKGIGEATLKANETRIAL